MRQLFKPARGSRRRGDNADSVAASPQPPPEPNIPWPPRFRWLKRLSLAYLVFVICLALLYQAWTAYSHRQLAAAIAAVHARAEPALPEDFDPPPIPDAQNAAVPLRQAISHFNPAAGWQSQLTQEARNSTTFLVRHLEPADVAVVYRVLWRQHPTLRRVRIARRITQADWGIRLRRNIIAVPVPHLNDLRELAEFASAVAVVRHREGEHAASLEMLRDILGLAQHMAASAPFEVCEEAGSRLEIGVTDLVEQFAPTLDLRDGTAARAAARALQADLLDDRRRAANHVRVAQAQRAWSRDLFLTYFEGKGALTEPMYRLDAARAIHGGVAAVAAARCESFADVTRILPKVYPEFEALPHEERRFSPKMPPRLLRHARFNSWFIRSPQRTPETYFRALADRRAAAVLLAVRMYEHDHAGALPESAAGLIGEYLTQIPKDPFAAGAAPLQVVRRGDDEIIIYSIGVDGVDDGGAEVDQRGLTNRNRFASIDFVYRFARAGTTATTTPSR